jgi:hypothetical protein
VNLSETPIFAGKPSCMFPSLIYGNANKVIQFLGCFHGWNFLCKLDEDIGSRDDFFGGVCFDLSKVPMRMPPDSPLVPQ